MLYDNEIVSDVSLLLNIVFLHAETRDASTKPSEQFTFARTRLLNALEWKPSNDHIKHSSFENTRSSLGGAMEGFLTSLNKKATRKQLTTQ